MTTQSRRSTPESGASSDPPNSRAMVPAPRLMPAVRPKRPVRLSAERAAERPLQTRPAPWHDGCAVLEGTVQRVVRITEPRISLFSGVLGLLGIRRTRVAYVLVLRVLDEDCAMYCEEEDARRLVPGHRVTVECGPCDGALWFWQGFDHDDGRVVISDDDVAFGFGDRFELALVGAALAAAITTVILMPLLP